MVENYEEVMRHHRAAWRAERIGWAAIAVVLAAALLGVFGDGPASQTEAGSDRTLKVEYDRFLRSSAPSLYRFHVHPSLANSDHVVRMRLDRSLLERLELESIVPEPELQASGPGYGEFTFRLTPGEEPLAIDLRFRPATFGRQQGHVSIGSHSVVIEQYVYP